MINCIPLSFKVLCKYNFCPVFYVGALIIFSSFCLVANAENDDKPSMIKNRSDFNFVAAGDFGCNDNANKTIRGMINKNPELVIALGDLSYEKKDATCWLRSISFLDSNDRVKVSIGEHDVVDNVNKYYQYVNHFNLTKPFYSFDFENAHFLVMATGKGTKISYLNDSEQYDFVQEDLRKAHNNKSIDWIIVSSFRSFYSSNTTHPGLDALQDVYHRLFDKYGVDLVLQAHNHNYQRTYPLSYNETKQFTPIITDKNTDEYQNIKKGQIFLTVGTGGEKLHNFTGQAPFVIKQFMRHGFLNIDLTEKGSKLSGTFYDSEQGNAIDHFTIKKKEKNGHK